MKDVTSAIVPEDISRLLLLLGNPRHVYDLQQGTMDHIAVEHCGEVLTAPEDAVQELDDLHLGYGFRWVGTPGGIAGPMTKRLILVGKVPQTKAFLREGRVRAMVRETGTPRSFAERIERVSHGIKFAVELPVRVYVIQTIDTWSHPFPLPSYSRNAWDVYPGAGKGVWAWHHAWRLPDTELSESRLDACAALVQRLLSGSQENR